MATMLLPPEFKRLLSALDSNQVEYLVGFNLPGLTAEWFLRKGSVLRIGQEPLRFDIVNDIDAAAGSRNNQFG